MFVSSQCEPEPVESNLRHPTGRAGQDAARQGGAVGQREPGWDGRGGASPGEAGGEARGRSEAGQSGTLRVSPLVFDIQNEKYQ